MQDFNKSKKKRRAWPRQKKAERERQVDCCKTRRDMLAWKHPKLDKKTDYLLRGPAAGRPWGKLLDRDLSGAGGSCGSTGKNVSGWVTHTQGGRESARWNAARGPAFDKFGGITKWGGADARAKRTRHNARIGLSTRCKKYQKREGRSSHLYFSRGER